MSAVAPGTLLAGRFRVTGAPIGQGATGVVLPAVDEHTGRDVAIKLLHEHLAGDATALGRLAVEAGTATRLAHPHILPARGVWAAGAGRQVLVTELVPGARSVESLDAPVDPVAVVELGLQLASALDAAHRASLVHGDVRPGNVLLGPSGAQLFDFGLAAGEGRRPGETAPEVHEGAPPGVPADLYGIGVVLYRAVAGHNPWDGPTPWAIIGAQRQGLPGPPPGPRGLSLLIASLLQPSPALRPPDAAAVRRALVQLQRNPERPPRLARRWVAPIRPGRAWMVHGVDPATGGRALVAAELGRARARSLARHLDHQGWRVDVAREALGATDLLWVALSAAIGAVVVPVLGLVLGAWLALWLLSQRCEPRLREALPLALTPIPPRQRAAGTEYAVSVGLLLLVGAGVMALFPPAAVLPLGLALAVGLWAFVEHRGDVGRRARDARVQNGLLEVRGTLERSEIPMDHQLALLGELDVLEAEWSAGRLETHALLLRIEAVAEEVGDPTRFAGTGRAAEALRRGRSLALPREAHGDAAGADAPPVAAEDTTP